MNPRFEILLPAFAMLLSGATQAHAQTVAELPGGNGAAFRGRMMDWSDPVPSQRRDHPVATVAPAAPPGVLPRLTSRFGYRVDPLRGGERMHTGIDIPAPLGTPVHASAFGSVRFAGWAGGYGELVELDHGGGLSTRYAHLSRILVNPGDRIGVGEVVGLMGSTGRSTGSHLHFEVRATGRPLDPLAYLSGGVPMIIQDVYGLGPMDSGTPHLSAFARRRAEVDRIAGDNR